MKKKYMYVVMRMYEFPAGVAHDSFPNGFMPVFKSRAKAVKWNGADDSSIAKIEITPICKTSN